MPPHGEPEQKKEMKDAYEKEHLMSPELPYESRYFSVLLNEDGKALSADTGQIVSVDDSEAMEYAETVWEKGQDKGFYGRLSVLCVHFGFRGADYFSGLQKKS